MILHTIIDKFIKTVKNYRDKICLVIDNKEYTYGDLDEMSNGIAWEINKIVPEIQLPILVFGDNPLQIACSIIGVMKSRNIVVPISNKTPTNRVNEIINACNINGYISLNEHTDLNLPYIHVTYERLSEFLYDGSINDDAYIIYTSGTTGKSKGVLVKHEGFVNSIVERNMILGIDSDSHTINLMGFQFDGFLMSFFSPLIVGAKLFFAKSIFDLNCICSIIKKSLISTFLCTPTFLKNLLNYAEDGLLDNIKLISLAGEQVNRALIEKCVKKYPVIQIANEYGPTENSICTSINPDIRKQEVISVGKLIKNVEAKIMNGSKTCEPGEIGELYLSGVGLAKGYVNDEILTKKKFVRYDNRIWYHTGDLAYWYKSEIVIVGRIDNQIKVNGYRLDLYEIENAIMQYARVEDCAVTYNENDGLTAYIVSSFYISREHIIQFLRERIAEYMIPTNYKQVTAIPMKDSGKIDIAALNALGDLYAQDSEPCEKIVIASHVISEIYKELLKLDECNDDSNFYALGGNSLNGVILCELLKKQFDFEIEIEDIRINPTPKLLAKRILNYKEEHHSVAIRPFNRFWFIDCYFTSILAVLEYYSIPIAPFIRSFIIQDVVFKDSYQLLYDYKRPLLEIFSRLGLMFDPGILENDFEVKILNHVMRDRVVMLHVDCFYIPYCKDKYQREHFEHVIAIIGFDWKSKDFDIIDQEKLESVSFMYHKASLDSVREAAYAEIINRATFDNMDFVALYPLVNRNVYDNRILDETQFNFVVEKTIEYLNNKPQDAMLVLQRILNYLRVEKEVFRYTQDDAKINFLKKKEIQLMRFFMAMGERKKDNYAGELVGILMRWERF